MPTRALELLCHWRRAATASLMTGCLLLAACGGSSHSSSTTTSQSAKARGPSDLTANLIGTIPKNQRRLKDVKAVCPHGPVSRYPVRCRFTATDSGERIAPSVAVKHPRAARALERPHPVAGTITVLGVFRPTRTYEYTLDYAPTR